MTARRAPLISVLDGFAAKELAQGAQIMPPFNKVDLAACVVEVLH